MERQTFRILSLDLSLSNHLDLYGQYSALPFLGWTDQLPSTYLFIRSAGNIYFAKFFSVLSGGDEYRIGDVVPGFSHSKISAHPNNRGVGDSTGSQTDSPDSDVRSIDTWDPRGMANVADE